MQGFVDRLASAIATEEGYYSQDPNVPPRRLNNPGDITATPGWKGLSEGRFRKYSTAAEGICDLYRLILVKMMAGATLRELIYSWAPPNENNTENYIRETARRVGIPDDE